MVSTILDSIGGKIALGFAVIIAVLWLRNADLGHQITELRASYNAVVQNLQTSVANNTVLKAALDEQNASVAALKAKADAKQLEVDQALAELGRASQLAAARAAVILAMQTEGLDPLLQADLLISENLQ